MSSPTFDSLRQTLKSLRRRRSNLFILRQVSICAIVIALLALLMTAISASMDLDKAGTIVLFGISLLLIGSLLWLLSRTLQRRHADDQHLAHYVEEHIPDFEQRLITSLEFTEEDLVHGRQGVSRQFIQHLWEDAQLHVAEQQQQVESVTPARASWISFSSAMAVVAIVAVILVSSDALFQAGSRLVWPFAISEPVVFIDVPANVEISVEPGDLEMQRGDSLTIVARVTNAIPGT
ncbi:MAG TPA: hypothetical protein QGI39_07185, partial [Gammaproteobacteria bacterium]|nr:hypothetical protein [Gammaproteobacteria bacterium]